METTSSDESECSISISEGNTDNIAAVARASSENEQLSNHSILANKKTVFQCRKFSGRERSKFRQHAFFAMDTTDEDSGPDVIEVTDDESNHTHSPRLGEEQV